MRVDRLRDFEPADAKNWEIEEYYEIQITVLKSQFKSQSSMILEMPF